MRSAALAVSLGLLLAVAAGPGLRGGDEPWWRDWLPDAVEYLARWGPRLSVAAVKVRLGADLSDADPLWNATAELVRSAALDLPQGRELVDLCEEGNQSEYATLVCANDTVGAILRDGIPLDAYFCGSNESGIQWDKPPVKQVCNATPGTAYNASGICGNSSTKELVRNIFLYFPLWIIEPQTTNPPGLRCLLGLGNCDIEYCQGCPGRCGPA